MGRSTTSASELYIDTARPVLNRYFMMDPAHLTAAIVNAGAGIKQLESFGLRP
jgi:hypothetical protein